AWGDGLISLGAGWARWTAVEVTEPVECDASNRKRDEYGGRQHTTIFSVQSPAAEFRACGLRPRGFRSACGAGPPDRAERSIRRFRPRRGASLRSAGGGTGPRA